MDVTALLIFILIFGLIAYGAYYIITKFLPEPIRTPALAIVGVLLLIVLLSAATGYLPMGHGVVIK